MKVNEISTTQLNWIISALNYHIAMIKNEMDASEDGSPIWAFGEVMMEGRQNLVTKLQDIIEGKYKNIKII